MKIAVLITCYNRYRVSLRCLEALHQCSKPEGLNFDIYLVDDASPDETGRIVKETYPEVRVINGNGKLYWCGGMRKAWQVACRQEAYDFYLWLNDDVRLFQQALIELLSDYALVKDLSVGVIAGVCCDPRNNEMTYGGRDDIRMLTPSGYPQRCKYIHGNIVLIPRETFNQIAGLSECFTHGFGDSDYGLRSLAAGRKCWITSRYVGYCSQHQIMGPWLSSKVPIGRRWKLLFAITGANLREYIIYRRKHWPYRWPIHVLKLVIQVIFPWPFEFYQRALCYFRGDK